MSATSCNFTSLYLFRVLHNFSFLMAILPIINFLSYLRELFARRSPAHATIPRNQSGRWMTIRLIGYSNQPLPRAVIYLKGGPLRSEETVLKGKGILGAFDSIG